MNTPKEFEVGKTVISTPGVVRCCLATVACEHLDAGRKVSEGEKSECAHCHRKFTLRIPIKGKPVWFPDDFEFGPATP